MHLMEQRDGWFSNLKAHIESTHTRNGLKSMVMAHSWGANVFLHFLYWAEAAEPGAAFTHRLMPHLTATPQLTVPV